MNDVMLITGANKGIGYSMACKWLEQGNIAIVLDISCTAIDLLKDKYGDKLMTIVCDISDHNSVIESIGRAIQKYKYVDIAVHNACLCVFKSLSQHSVDEYKRVFEVNFIGAVNITKVILPYMLQNKKGRICYTSSGVGVTGFTNISGYSASKGAIEAFAKCMRLENFGNGITFHTFYIHH